MSLIQVWLSKDCARVAVDTIAIGAAAMTGVRAETSKLMHLPHAGVVLAHRGSQWAFFQVLAQLYLTPGNDSFDSIRKAMPTRIHDAHTHCPAEVPAPASCCDLFLVGYSEKLGAMAATQFDVNLHSPKTSETAITEFRIGPGLSPVPPLDNDAAMLEVAHAQVSWMLANEPALATGGRLLVAEIRREAITTRNAGPLVKAPQPPLIQ